MADMFETIDTCPVPVIARVHGAALGGGMGLCAVGDLVIAESGTRFGFTETRLGILPAVISPFVIAKIGESHARALFPAAAGSTPRGRPRIGLVHEVVEGEEALDAAVDAAVADLLAAGPTAARAAKAIVREVRGLGHGSTKWHTARVIARQRTSDEAQEGFRAFTEKRDPPGRRIRVASRRRRPDRAICDDRDIDVRGTESEPGCRAHRGDDALRPALDRERSTACATRWGPWRVASDAIDALVAPGRRPTPEPAPDDSDPHAVHRQPRRDRDAHHAHVRPARDPRGRARDRGPRRARPARCRRGRRRGPCGRRRRAPPGLRLPCRERRLRRGRASLPGSAGSARRPRRSGSWATRPRPAGSQRRSASRSSPATTNPTHRTTP